MSVSPASAILEQCVCVSGFLRRWETNTHWFACAGCDAGKYSTQNNATTCTSCSPGKFAARGNLTGTPGPESLACLSCGGGLYTGGADATACLECRSGTFANSTGNTGCTPCEQGFSSTSKATQCLACIPGKFSSVQGQDTCTPCPLGTFTANPQSVVCQNCSAGYYAAEIGRSECEACLAGTYSGQTGLTNRNNCSQCARAQYSTAIGASSRATCTRCQVGLSSLPGSTGCTSCLPGEFPNPVYGACSSCPRHSVNSSNASSLTECKCSPGYFMGFNAKAVGGEESHLLESNQNIIKVHKFSTSPASITILSDTVLEIVCNGRQINIPVLWRQGSYPSLSFPVGCIPPMIMRYQVDAVPDHEDMDTHIMCIACPPGTYSAQGVECVQCPTGKYQDNAASTGCDGCPPGTHNPTGGDACIPCKQGTYQSGNQCIPCSDGFYTVGMAATVCASCPANSWSNNASGGCRLCPAEATSPGATGLTGCICPAGFILTVAQNIPYCTPCNRGFYSLSGATRCIPCPAGTFGNSSRLSACLPCPTDPPMYSNDSATTCVLCPPGTAPSTGQSSCNPCPIGKVCLGNGTVLDCPSGSFMTTGGLSRFDQCQKCPRNFFCANATSRESCPTGTISPEGSKTSHDCQCTDRFNCIYFTVITKRIVLTMTRQEFEARRLEIIQALATSSNISSENVRIISVQSQGQALRRVSNTMPLITIATIRVYGTSSGMNIDSAMMHALQKRGIPVKHIHTLAASNHGRAEVFKLRSIR